MSDDIQALLAVVDQHAPLWADSRNLGYYRTEVECTCGEKLTYGDHDEDPSWDTVWDEHRVADITKRGVTITWPSKHFECNCVPDLGPTHCHGCSEAAGIPVEWSNKMLAFHPASTTWSEQ